MQPRNLYPLGPGYAWSYDVDTGTGVPTLAITRVVEATGARFEVTSGTDVIVYEVRDDGIFRPGNSTFLLKAPIRVGAEWPSTSGRISRVTSVTANVETTEGRFRGCVEVRETGGEAGREVRTVYCPNVGPVYVEAIQQLSLSSEPVRVIARLRGHQLGNE